ncbi:hypothetical protein R1flu_028619 [Riccia fluitans]|uniref:Uncharacterized protein n=1 Tax=Riccia fluitans TaxID=41844 RepID=A0ABD1XQ73_9MARC
MQDDEEYGDVTETPSHHHYGEASGLPPRECSRVKASLAKYLIAGGITQSHKALQNVRCKAPERTRRRNGHRLQISFIGKVSRHFFPLSAAEQEAVRGVRRKRESDSYESCSFKRRQELFRPSFSGSESSFKMVVPATGSADDGTVVKISKRRNGALSDEKR